ncbi:thiopeptide-type bacteriocin biosynthesis protein, partial [Streptomyces sp. NPDC057638]|uniref:thiopeptide-type bacteriocin biosynthesis protein n=1 Tax=Streptomyces sp. NPDC057638 TaxID=3346190 RepID=UPI0036B82650
MQLNVATGAQVRPELYAFLGEIALEVIGSGTASNFFFMHKPPGLRLRFQAREPGSREALYAELAARLGARSGLFDTPVRGIYEPESYLFGGPHAMPWVHDLFTADSLAWLHHHAERPAPLADWRLSLTLLRDLLDGLGIVGWEHRGVWETLQHEAGRALGEGR